MQVIYFQKKYWKNGFSVIISVQELAAAVELPPGFNAERLIWSQKEKR